MIRLNFALRRQSKLSLAEFQRYWRETHGPLVVSVSRKLRMRRYMQSHLVEDPLYDGLRTARTGMHGPFDGIASVWWDTREDLVAAMTSEEGKKAAALLLEDEKNFIDLARSPLWVSQEVVQINPMPENSIIAWPKSSWIKFCYLLQPKEGMSVAACHKTWNMEHGYLIRRHSGVTRFARRAARLRRADGGVVRSLRPDANLRRPGERGREGLPALPRGREALHPIREVDALRGQRNRFLE